MNPEKIRIDELFLKSKSYIDYDLYQFSYIIANWYKKQKNRESKVIELENLIIEKVPTMKPNIFVKVAKNFNHLVTQHYSISKTLLECFIARIGKLETLEDQIQATNELLGFGKFIKLYRLNVKDKVSLLINEKNIKELPKANFFQIMEIFSSVCVNSILQPIELEEIQDFFELRIEKELETFTHHEIKETLIFLITTKSKSDVILRKIESLFFSNIKKTPINEFTKILKLYEHRRLGDYHYIMNSVYKHIFHDFMDRSTQLNSKSLNSYLSTWKSVGKSQGVYSEGNIYEKFKELIEKHRGFNVDDPIGQGVILAIFSMSNFIGFIKMREIAEIAVKVLKPSFDYLDDAKLVALAYEISMNPGLCKEFWYVFNERIDNLMKNFDKKAYIYGIHLNLYLNDEESYSIIKDNISKHMTILSESWKTIRNRDLSLSSKTKYQQKVEKEFKALRISYISEHFHEYYIDIAIPSKKIAFEILGPGHYIFPESIINGKTKLKKNNIEKLGWKYVIIPFYSNKPTTHELHSIILSAIPLHNH